MTETKFLTYSLPVFEGPLDLLLTLISKNKIDIYDIEITTLVDQYLEQIKLMHSADMDVAAEFLEMASRLVYIKSAMLLPKYEDEAEDLKKELTGQLIEYHLCKQVAKTFSEIISFDFFVRSPDEIEYDMTYNKNHAPDEVLKAYIDAVGRGKKKLPPPVEAFSGIVHKKVISVASRVVHVMRRLWKQKSLRYNDVFAQSESKSELVATFLAVLELVRGKRVKVVGKDNQTELQLINKK